MAIITQVSPYIVGQNDVDKFDLQYPCLKAGMVDDALIFSDNLEMVPGVTDIRDVKVGDTFYDVKIEVMTPNGYWVINVFVADPKDLLELARQFSVEKMTETRLYFGGRFLAWWDQGSIKHSLVDLSHFYDDMDAKWVEYTQVLFDKH